MAADRDCPDTVNEFIDTQVLSRGLDERTAMAYRKDLEKLYLWLETSSMEGKSGNAEAPENTGSFLEERMEAYLDYLSREKGLRCSTIFRKQKVFGYYLSYLVSIGRLESFRPPPGNSSRAMPGCLPGTRTRPRRTSPGRSQNSLSGNPPP